MADPTKAEIMLDQVTKINALIRRFQLCKDHPIPPLRLDLWPSTKSTIKAYQENVQGRIDQLTAQRETVLALVEADMERESILAGIYGPNAQAALVAHPEAHVRVERAMYQCGACVKLERRLAVTVKSPVPVPILQQCDCGATMHRIRSGKDMLCPACREPLKKTDVVAVVRWD